MGRGEGGTKERVGGGGVEEGQGRQGRRVREIRQEENKPEELPQSEGSNRLSGTPANEWLFLSLVLEQLGTKRETFSETSGLSAAFSRGGYMPKFAVLKINFHFYITPFSHRPSISPGGGGDNIKHIMPVDWN